MREKQIQCWMCGSYDREAARCRIGKSNPKKKHVAITVAEILGPQALCLHSPYREPLLLRMRSPHVRFVWDSAIVRLAGPAIEIEIMDDDSVAERSCECPTAPQ